MGNIQGTLTVTERTVTGAKKGFLNKVTSKKTLKKQHGSDMERKTGRQRKGRRGNEEKGRFQVLKIVCVQVQK